MKATPALPRDVSVFDLTVWQACDVVQRAEALAVHLGRKPWTTEGIPIRDWLAVTPMVVDVLCILRHAPGGLAVLHGFACDCVEHVLPLWDSLVRCDIPQDWRPDRALAAARLGTVEPGTTEDAYAAYRAAGRSGEAVAGVAYAAWAVGMGHHARAVNAAAEAHETHAARVEERQWQRARLVEILCPEGGP